MRFGISQSNQFADTFPEQDDTPIAAETQFWRVFRGFVRLITADLFNSFSVAKRIHARITCSPLFAKLWNHNMDHGVVDRVWSNIRFNDFPKQEWVRSSDAAA